MDIFNTLLTGGNGRLGKELRDYAEFDAPSHRTLDITDDFIRKSYKMIVHAAAYTDVDKAEEDPETCFTVNVGGTASLIREYGFLPFVFISSEFCYHPCNVYSYSKLAAEQLIQKLVPSYLIIRTLFKPRPYPWPTAWSDVYTKGDYLDVIAPLIIKEIEDWDGEPKLVHVGTKRKTLYDLARETKPDVLATSVDRFTGVKRMKDYL